MWFLKNIAFSCLMHQTCNWVVQYIYSSSFVSHLASISTMVTSKSSWSQVVKNTRPANLSIPARNLQPQDLGAVIFGCTNNTIQECHSRQLFGMLLISLDHNSSLSFVFTKLSYPFNAFVSFPVRGVYHSMPPKAFQLVEWSTDLVTICGMFQACQEHILHMYETVRKDYLSSSSIMMIADCMVFTKLHCCREWQVLSWIKCMVTW